MSDHLYTAEEHIFMEFFMYSLFVFSANVLFPTVLQEIEFDRDTSSLLCLLKCKMAELQKFFPNSTDL